VRSVFSGAVSDMLVASYLAALTQVSIGMNGYGEATLRLLRARMAVRDSLRCAGSRQDRGEAGVHHHRNHRQPL